MSKRRYRWYMDDPSLLVLANDPNWAYGEGETLIIATRCQTCANLPINDHNRCFWPSREQAQFLQRAVNKTVR